MVGLIRQSRSLLVIAGLILVSVAGAFLPLVWPRVGVERAPESTPLISSARAFDGTFHLAVGTPAFSPDGKHVAFVEVGSGVQILALDSKSAIPLAGSTAEDRSPVFSTDGASIGVVRGFGVASKVCVLPSGGGASRCIAKTPHAAGLDWMRNDKHLVVAYRPSDNESSALFLIETATGHSRRLSPTFAADQWPSVSSRGRAVAFVRDGIYWVYEITGNPPAIRRTRKLAAPAAPVSYSAGWSSDSRFLYFASAGRLWRLGFNGRARPELLAGIDGAKGAVAATRAGRRLVYETADGLSLLEGF